MTTLVTGATGLVGAAVLRFHSSWDNVRALVRPNSDRRNLSGVDCEIVTGDLTEPESLKPTVRGCRDGSFTVAAAMVFGFLIARKWTRVNVQGTVDLIRTAAAAGVSRIVCAGRSVAALAA